MTRWIVLVLVVAVAACSAGGGTRDSTRPTRRRSIPHGRDTTVERIVDGDTVVVHANEKVRLIGIDTPETKDPRRPVECFGREASQHIAGLIPTGTAVQLVRDVSATDRYGRTLAYVYRSSDRLFVNAAMVRDGYAAAATFPPDVAHADEFVALQREARAASRGLWRACGTAHVATALP